MNKVLTIAGSDCSAGAGIQADLKAFYSRGVYGMSVITALTAQNTTGVQGIVDINAEFIGKQIDSIMSDFEVEVWKTGMLSNRDIIQMVISKIKFYKISQLVVDPVMVSKGGAPLLQSEAQKPVIKGLIPLAYILTPNLYEAQVLTGMKIKTIQDSKSAAKKIFRMGVKNVVIKGGHLSEKLDAIDILYNGDAFIEFRASRIETQNTHGTGCTFASTIAAELTKGNNVTESILIAKAYITTLLQKFKEIPIGHGHGPVNPSLENPMDLDLDLIDVIF